MRFKKQAIKKQPKYRRVISITIVFVLVGPQEEWFKYGHLLGWKYWTTIDWLHLVSPHLYEYYNTKIESILVKDHIFELIIEPHTAGILKEVDCLSLKFMQNSALAGKHLGLPAKRCVFLSLNIPIHATCFQQFKLMNSTCFWSRIEDATLWNGF